jgi:hypothetical protein
MCVRVCVCVYDELHNRPRRQKKRHPKPMASALQKNIYHWITSAEYSRRNWSICKKPCCLSTNHKTLFRRCSKSMHVIPMLEPMRCCKSKKPQRSWMTWRSSERVSSCYWIRCKSKTRTICSHQYGELACIITYNRGSQGSITINHLVQHQ